MLSITRSNVEVYARAPERPDIFWRSVKRAVLRIASGMGVLTVSGRDGFTCNYREYFRK